MKLIDTFHRTGKAIEKAFSMTPDRPGDMDILDKLKAEHQEVSDLLDRLVNSDAAPQRKALLKRIKMALVPHARAEEKIVYDAILAQREKSAKIDGEEGYMEHALADRMLATLSGISNAASPEFSAAAKVLKELIEHHVQEEERNVWKDVREHFDDDQRMAMNRKFEAAKKKVQVA